MTKIARRQQQAALESTWTVDQAVEWARGGRRWPARRFRVVGSPLGNSRLLREHDATRAAQRYGGRVAKVIPTRREVAVDLVDDQQAGVQS